jgi:metal-responsive CopG/Arc/MetJ family transcriptional regulator|nr:MAG TPA: antitoxin [Caudoviricetes sp.]
MEKAKTISITVSRETLEILDRIVLLTDKTRSAVIRDMVKESWIDYCRKQGGLFE